MITVRKTDDGFERIGGNPILLSRDGEVKARLRVVCHSSWEAKDRERFGIYQAEPFVCPDGKRTVGPERFESDGKVVRQVFDTEDIQKLSVTTDRTGRDPKLVLEDLVKRVEELERKFNE
jgi:hypothetical protein